MFGLFPKKIKNAVNVVLSIFFLSLLFSSKIFAQQDSCHLQVSLLTVTPGEELYSTWGHTAIRIHDTVTNQDIVYNYGTFDFSDPKFYSKFVRGKLLYYLSSDDYNSFLEETRYEQRGITEQMLNLTCDQKRNIIMLLEANMMAMNRFYKYEILYDNCTTRVRDLIEKGTDSTIHFGKVLQSKASFRNMIHEYLNRGDKQWSKLGIDILLGSKTDADATPYQVMFLPDYLMQTLDSSTVSGKPLVSGKEVILRQVFHRQYKQNLTHPFFIFLCLFVLIAFLSFSKNQNVQKMLNSFDGMLLFITGLLGILILFMWFGTDHIVCRNNYNILWAWPPNIVAAFFIHSKRSWARKYFLFYSLILLLLIVFWKAVPQHFNISLIPIFAIMIFRSLILTFRKK
ncbi:MAG TPA: DUF4105 domain-containing protein [Hanamia sp.]|nr:DUF4105 domain-containing protein [Hanamia sp.]